MYMWKLEIFTLPFELGCDSTNKVKLANLPTITTGGVPISRFWDRAPETKTLLLESPSSGTMWAELRTYSVTASTKQPNNRKACIFPWNRSNNNGGEELKSLFWRVWSWILLMGIQRNTFRVYEVYFHLRETVSFHCRSSRVHFWDGPKSNMHQSSPLIHCKGPGADPSWHRANGGVYPG